MAAPTFLIIQTAFIGDVILATAVAEKLHQQDPDAAIDFLLRKGNEDLLKGHPFIRTVIIWDKKKGKLKNLLAIIRRVKSSHYDRVINIHRFASSGLITAFSGARTKVGFDKNPLSAFFSLRKKHDLTSGIHEVDRNQSLIADITDEMPGRPRLYPTAADRQVVERYKLNEGRPLNYVCLAPASVWFTKQFPKEKWIELIKDLQKRRLLVYLLGASSDKPLCRAIQTATGTGVVDLSGQLTFLQSSALMEDAVMNYVNDSAPMHLASAVDAPVAAIFCSTVPAFGFGPLSTKNFIIETREALTCRPCGLHGYRECPQGHFKCALTISVEQLMEPVVAS